MKEASFRAGAFAANLLTEIKRLVAWQQTRRLCEVLSAVQSRENLTRRNPTDPAPVEM
jgi:hypothetical protein